MSAGNKPVRKEDLVEKKDLKIKTVRKSNIEDENMDFFNMLLNNSKNNISINNSFNLIFENKIEFLETKIRNLNIEIEEISKKANITELTLENLTYSNQTPLNLNLDLIMNQNGRNPMKFKNMIEREEKRNCWIGKLGVLFDKIPELKSKMKVMTQEQIEVINAKNNEKASRFDDQSTDEILKKRTKSKIKEKIPEKINESGNYSLRNNISEKSKANNLILKEKLVKMKKENDSLKEYIHTVRNSLENLMGLDQSTALSFLMKNSKKQSSEIIKKQTISNGSTKSQYLYEFQSQTIVENNGQPENSTGNIIKLKRVKSSLDKREFDQMIVN